MPYLPRHATHRRLRDSLHTQYEGGCGEQGQSKKLARSYSTVGRAVIKTAELESARTTVSLARSYGFLLSAALRQATTKNNLSLPRLRHC
jgi:hypothetical protein